MTEEKPEIIDLVDEDDQVIKQIERDDSINNFKVHGGYIRVVDCYIMNSKGQIWVPRRTANKRIAANGLDFSIGEHMKAGESYEAAIIRGFQEEVGFTPDTDKLKFLGVNKPLKFQDTNKPQDGSDIFQGFFVYHSDETPDLNPEDFVAAVWMKPSELVAKIESGDKAKSNIIPTVKKFLIS